LIYAVETEPASAAWKRRQRKLEARLGPGRSRPPRMHWRTFFRMLDALDEIDVKFNMLLVAAYRAIVRSGEAPDLE
jgi:hypothetical protein